MPNEMIERVARAISAEFLRLHSASDDEIQREVELLWTEWTGEAHAAIEAMREPTSEMIEAGDFDMNAEFTPANSTVATAQVWRAMIDAALLAAKVTLTNSEDK